MKIVRSTLPILFALITTACVTNPSKEIDVSLGERTELYFTGRGSSAGILMDAYMGGAGIAIGIAIDEGIANEIENALMASDPNFSITALVKNVLAERAKGGADFPGAKSVIVDKYGFRSAPEDKVVPLVELRVVCESSSAQKVKAVFDQDSLTMTFDQVKTNGKLVKMHLRQAVETVFEQKEYCAGQ